MRLRMAVRSGADTGDPRKNSAAMPSSGRCLDLLKAACLSFAICCGRRHGRERCICARFPRLHRKPLARRQSRRGQRKTFDAAFAGVEPDYSIPDLDLPRRPKVDNNGQAEFTKTAADYLSKAYLDKLAVQGRAFLDSSTKQRSNVSKA